MKSKITPRNECSFEAVMLRGLIETGDRCAYFGSLMALSTYVNRAIKMGWISVDETIPAWDPSRWQPTDLGRRVYAESGLAALPRSGRGYAWDWSKVRLPKVAT